MNSHTNCWWKAQEKDKVFIKQFNQICEHFGAYLFKTGWLENLISKEIFFQIGIDSIIKYGFCTFCSGYLGHRYFQKNKKVKVLSAFCIENRIIVRPENRCPIWEPVNFIKQLIKHDINKKLKKN